MLICCVVNPVLYASLFNDIFLYNQFITTSALVEVSTSSCLMRNIGLHFRTTTLSRLDWLSSTA